MAEKPTPLRPTVEEPALTEFDKSIIGKAAVQIRIPVTDFRHLLKYADLLAGLVEEIRFQAGRTDGPGYDSPRYVNYRRGQLSQIRRTAAAVADAIRRIHKGLKDDEL